MDVRHLTEADAEVDRDVHLRALREHPEAFGRTPEDVEQPMVLRLR